MRIAVFGAGQIGVWLGGRLSAAGAEVTLVGRPRVLDAVATHGIRLTDLGGGEIMVPPGGLRLAVEPSALADAELVLVTVKSTATGGAAAAIAEHAPPDAAVIAFQNGVSNAERLRGHLPGRVVLAGMVPYNIANPAPGHWHRGTEGELKVEATPALAAVLPLFAAAGVPLEQRIDMPAVLWGKLVVNLNNAVNALSGETLLNQLRQRDYRRCTALCQREANRLLRRARIVTVPATPLPTWALPHVLALPDRWYARVAGRGGVRIDKRARSSMADDLAAGRPTEVDYLNGEVVRLAERLGGRAPVNTAVVALVRAAEAGAPPRAAAALLDHLRRA